MTSRRGPGTARAHSLKRFLTEDHMTRSAALVALVVWLGACDGKDASPTAAGNPTAGMTALTVNGTVFGNGRPIAGASVIIMDGMHAGQTRDTTEAGHYSFMNL